MTIPVVLSIAGSDSGGGAGIQADLKTFHAFGTLGTTAITAITAQNTMGVAAIHAVPGEIVRAQIEAVATDLHPAAVKSGMLANRELVLVVARALQDFGLNSYVLDPVMVSTRGARLIDQDAEQEILKSLVPLATLVTPNLDEAAILTGLSVTNPDEMREAAKALVAAGAGAALLKGGHLEGGEIVDILYDGTNWREWRRGRIHTTSTHGTGCTLSAAITAGLTTRRTLHGAVEAGLAYVERAMSAAPNLGSGQGPLNHMVTAT